MLNCFPCKKPMGPGERTQVCPRLEPPKMAESGTQPCSRLLIQISRLVFDLAQPSRETSLLTVTILKKKIIVFKWQQSQGIIGWNICSQDCLSSRCCMGRSSYLCNLGHMHLLSLCLMLWSLGHTLMKISCLPFSPWPHHKRS